MTITSSELRTDARVGPMSAMPARNVVIATTVETTPIAATASRPRGSSGSERPGPTSARTTHNSAAAWARCSARTRAGTPAPKRLLRTMYEA